MKLTKENLANAFALTTGVTFAVCRVLFFLFPDFLMTVSRSWFHTTNQYKNVGGLNLFLLGLASSVIAAWLLGYLFGWSLEYFSKKK